MIFQAGELAYKSQHHTLGSVLGQLVGDNLLVADKEEKKSAIAQDTFHNGVLAITVVVEVVGVSGHTNTLTMPNLV